MHARVWVRVHVWVCMCARMCMCVHVHTHVHVCVWGGAQQDGQPTKVVFWSMVLDVPDDGGGRQQCSLPAQ